MAAPSANALYVLRLVWRGTLPLLPLRQFSGVRAIGTTASASSADSRTPTPTTTTADTDTTPDFLESDESEYASASSFLPHRGAAHPHPIPWPTIFEHDTGAARKGKRRGRGSTPSGPKTPRPCDLVARLVAEGRLAPARKVYTELRALDTRIEPRKVYLDAAVTSLNDSQLGPETQRADFMFWLALFPNRPATPSTPTLKAMWTPIVNTILDQHMDVAFISEFLALAGKKGLLPAVLPLLIAPLVTLSPPNVSERAIETAISAYRASTTSQRGSTSQRAQQFSALTSQQIAQWWNTYLRRLSLSGYESSARALLYSPPEGVRWTRFTRAVVLEQGLERRAAAIAAAQEREAAEKENPLLGLKREEARTLPQRIRAALSSERLPSVVDLAGIQAELERLGRASLLERFKKRFLGRKDEGRTLLTVPESWWLHAQLMRLMDAENYKAAVQLFAESFLWIGLPRPTVSPATDPPASPRLIPTIQIITTVLPAVLAREPNAAAYHARYLGNLRRCPPSLAPTAYTHLAFVRTLARKDVAGATEALTTIMASGLEPGLAPWNALLIALQSRGEVDAALRLLSSLETGASVQGASRVMPAPNPRTYLGLIHVAAKSGHEAQAALYLKRFRKFINVNAARGREISDEDKAILDVAKKAVRAGRKERKKEGEGEEAVEEKAAATGS